MLSHAPRSPLVHNEAGGDRNQTTVASARNLDPAAAGTVPTTSSSCNLDPCPCARPRRQTQNADESLRIFLVILRAHGERRQIVAIERVLRLPADHRHVPLVEGQSYHARHLCLRLFHECIQSFTQWGEP